MIMSEIKKQVGGWPWLVVFIGLSFLTITGWSIYRASIGTSRVTDPAYYSHGLKYNQSTIEEKTAESMGWQLTSAIKGDRLIFTLETGGAKPVAGCKGELLIFNGDNRLSLALREEKAGLYYAVLPERLTGSLTGDLLLQRGGARLNRRLLINL